MCTIFFGKPVLFLYTRLAVNMRAIQCTQILLGVMFQIFFTYDMTPFSVSFYMHCLNAGRKINLGLFFIVYVL